MQHVKKQWLSRFAYFLLSIDILLFVVYLLFENTGASSGIKDYWGITAPVLIIAAVHGAYILTVFQLIRKRFEWLATIISVTLFAILFAIIIDTSGNTNLVYRLGYAGLVFLMAMSGPFAPIATVALTWLIMVFSYASVVSGTRASLGFNLVINTIVTLAALGGWQFFKRYYVKTKDAETIALSKLLEQEQFKSNVMLESISDGVMIINTMGAVQVLNQSAATMLGWTKEEALNIDYPAMFQAATAQPSGAVNAAEIVKSSLANKKAQQGVSLLQTKNGRQVFVDIVASPIMETVETKTADGTPPVATKQLVGIIAVLRNVDEQKRQEQQRTDFIATASHEMRTPVASIQGFIELALNPKMSQIDEQAKGYLQKAHQATKHLSELFQDLLTISDSDNGKLANNPKIIEVGELLKELLAKNKATAEQKGLQVIYGDDTPNAPLLYTRADPERLRQVIGNLFENAIHYTTAGSITLSASPTSNSIIIRVADTGVGIGAEDVPHLFQEFYRADSSATRTVGGTGLGLYICRQIITMMGGRIWVDSIVGQGSTFYVELPLIDPTTGQPVAKI